MTLLPDVRRQIREAAERQTGSRWRRLRNRVMPLVVSRQRSALRLSSLAPVLSILVAVGIAVVFVAARGSGQQAGRGSSGTVKVIFRALPTAQAPVVTEAAMSRTVEIMRKRLSSAFHHFQVTSSGPAVVVVVRDAPAGARGRVLALSARSRLEFYDWEATVLAPNGKTVASQLQTQNPNALTISQGSGGAAPGNVGAGSMSLYSAVKLASEQPKRASADNALVGPEYFLFGAPGSRACTIAARAQGKLPVAGAHCLLSGPYPDVQDLDSNLPIGVTPSMGRRLMIQQGTVVLQAAASNPSQHVSSTDPTAQFYVLSDHPAPLGNDISHPRQGIDQSGAPDVTFGLPSSGAKALQRLTAAIAHRGAVVSGLGQTLNQHFAIAVDNTLITVPQIDFKTYPDGVPGGGIDVSGSFTISSARDLATQLRLGPLPLALTPTTA